MIRPPPRSTLFPYPTLSRSVYGERDEPYRVISRLGQRLEATLAPDAVLSIIVETVAQALKLPGDRKSTRLNSSHQIISYAVFCLKKKKNNIESSKTNP